MTPARKTLWALLSLLLFATSAAANDTDRVIKDGAKYPEGPLWFEGRLYFAEMMDDAIFVWSGVEVVKFWEKKGCGPTSIAPYKNNLFAVTCHLSNALEVIDRDGNPLKTIKADDYGHTFINPNDSYADEHGGVYFTSSGHFRPMALAQGSVYYLSPHGQVNQVIAGLRYTNGILIDHARAKLYLSEHLGRKVLEFAIEEPGRLSPPSTYIDLNVIRAQAGQPPRPNYPLAGPDGLELDTKGNLYICEYGAGRVWIVNPSKKLETSIEVPLPYITNISLLKNGAQIIITGATNNLHEPFSGQVILIDNPVYGN